MQTYCTGPARVWVKFAADGVPQPFGTCERAPRVRRVRAWEDVMNDLGGTKLPFERMYQGQIVMVGGMMTRWRESIALALASTPTTTAVALGAPPGFDIPGDVGRMMMLEGYLITLYVEFMYGSAAVNKPVMTVGGMPAGYRMGGAIYEGPDEDEIGTGAKKLQFMFYCMRDYITTNGIFAAYDNNMDELVGLPWEVTP